MRSALVGRHLGRIRLAGAHALCAELAGERERLVWLDAARGTAGLYLLRRGEVPRDEAAATGRTRQALLVFRKHLEGARVADIARIPGERWLTVQAGSAQLALRLASTPALSLALDGSPVATVGAGREAWPSPAAAPEREVSALEVARVGDARQLTQSSGRSLTRAWLALCPPLGPLARLLDETPEALSALQRRLAEPRPTLVAPEPLEDCSDAALAEQAVALLPFAPPDAQGVVLHPPSWREAAALFLAARLRGERFAVRRSAVLDGARRESRRLGQLEQHLLRDRDGLADPAHLRRSAEALLAFAGSVAPGAPEVDVPDPYQPELRLRVALDPRLSVPANADRLFHKARRIERARVQVEARLADTRRALGEAREKEERALAARVLSELEPAAAAPDRGETRSAGPRQWLTSRGLSVLVGRGAKENHHLTFAVARPEDVWLHARDVPGAHVILRDNEGRAGADDLREAAELAAFFSEANTAALVDVHVTRRKHVRPGRGGPGRVHVLHSDTLRVAPRDPEGRLRRR